MKTVFVLITTLLITACSSAPKYSTLEVSKTTVTYVTIPEELLTPCKPEKPIDTKTYLELKIWEREQLLTQYSISLLKTIKDCNLKIDKIKNLNNTASK